MLGLFLLILLLPITLYFLGTLILAEAHVALVFLRNWMYSNIYCIGVILGAMGRLIIPNLRSSEVPTDASNVENEITRGIKETWK